MRTLRNPVAAMLLPLGIILAACGGGAATPGLTYTPPSTAPSAAGSPAASPAASPATTPAPSVAASGDTVDATNVGSIGTALVAGANGMTVYTFTKDVADSGKSACSGSCLATWPALTIPAGTTPKAGAGVTGKLGTITRDDGALQVTYNGLPLYFFSGDSKAGDANGVYPGWEAVKP